MMQPSAPKVRRRTTGISTGALNGYRPAAQQPAAALGSPAAAPPYGRMQAPSRASLPQGRPSTASRFGGNVQPGGAPRANLGGAPSLGPVSSGDPQGSPQWSPQGGPYRQAGRPKDQLNQGPMRWSGQGGDTSFDQPAGSWDGNWWQGHPLVAMQHQPTNYLDMTPASQAQPPAQGIDDVMRRASESRAEMDRQRAEQPTLVGGAGPAAQSPAGVGVTVSGLSAGADPANGQAPDGAPATGQWWTSEQAQGDPTEPGVSWEEAAAAAHPEEWRLFQLGGGGDAKDWNYFNDHSNGLMQHWREEDMRRRQIEESRGQWQASVDEIMGRANQIGLDDSSMQEMLQAQQAQRAMAEGRAMTMALEMGHSAGLSPEAVGGALNQQLLQSGVQGAGQDAQLAMQQELQGLQAQIAQYQAVAQAMSLQAALAGNDIDRAFAATQAQYAHQNQMTAQDRAMRLGARLSEPDLGVAAIGALGSLGGAALGSVIPGMMGPASQMGAAAAPPGLSALGYSTR